MTMETPRSLRARAPRCLLEAGPSGPALPCGDGEGLLAVELLFDPEAGRIQAVRPWTDTDTTLPLLLPLVEPHAHLDKAFSWRPFANPSGEMALAMAANGREAAQRSAHQVLARGEQALEQAWRYGLRAIRSHVDSGWDEEQPSWDALQELQLRWRGRMDLQLCALVPLAHWSTPAGRPWPGAWRRAAACWEGARATVRGGIPPGPGAASAAAAGGAARAGHRSAHR